MVSSGNGSICGIGSNVSGWYVGITTPHSSAFQSDATTGSLWVCASYWLGSGRSLCFCITVLLRDSSVTTSMGADALPTNFITDIGIFFTWCSSSRWDRSITVAATVDVCDFAGLLSVFSFLIVFLLSTSVCLFLSENFRNISSRIVCTSTPLSGCIFRTCRRMLSFRVLLARHSVHL